MHVKVYLSYLHIHFQAYQALSHLEGHASFLPELLDVSMTMLETVVHMTTRRSRSFSPLDLPGIVCTLVPHLDVFINKSQVLTCGLPCSAILSTALMDSLKGASSLPPVANVPSIIRNLSVLVSQLETIANPSEANYAFCIKASKAISNNLDQILEKSISVNSRQTSDVSPKPHSEDTLADLNVSFGMEDVDVNLDDFNLADWFNFDASAIFDE